MKLKSNVEFVTDLMEYSQYGGVSQVFIIEAIRYYSELIISRGEPKDDPEAFINPTLWYKVAKDINQQVVDKYERKSK